MRGTRSVSYEEQAKVVLHHLLHRRNKPLGAFLREVLDWALVALARWRVLLLEGAAARRSRRMATCTPQRTPPRRHLDSRRYLLFTPPAALDLVAVALVHDASRSSMAYSSRPHRLHRIAPNLHEEVVAAVESTAVLRRSGWSLSAAASVWDWSIPSRKSWICGLSDWVLTMVRLWVLPHPRG